MRVEVRLADLNQQRIAAENGRILLLDVLAVTAGMLTTVIVLVPVMFTGGYTQQTMRPLNLMISSTLVASLLVALTVIPLVASRLLARPHEHRSWTERLFGNSERAVGIFTRFYLAILRKALLIGLVLL